MQVCACSSPCRHTQTTKDVFLRYSLPYLFWGRVSLASLVDAHCLGYTSWPAGNIDRAWNFVSTPPPVEGVTDVCCLAFFFFLFYLKCMYLGFELKSSCLCSMIYPLSHVLGPWISLFCKYRQRSSGFHKLVGTGSFPSVLCGCRGLEHHLWVCICLALADGVVGFYSVVVGLTNTPTRNCWVSLLVKSTSKNFPGMVYIMVGEGVPASLFFF